ncbi:cytochrome c [Granulicella sp. 5B5]|uniref:c-type cytochrome n=1 Tax=Granulicella sp. 5B5 TaxID=1617967 RepID=UPI0015F483A9|nr:cytochrome c [Granulicella sp. 5B5]
MAFAFVLHQPKTVTASSTARARGAELFATRGCAHCHGTDGVNGEIGPDLQLVRKRMNAARIFAQIHDGSKDMPAFADSLSTPQIDDLVAYLRTKRKHIIPPPPPTKPAATDPNSN